MLLRHGLYINNPFPVVDVTLYFAKMFPQCVPRNITFSANVDIYPTNQPYRADVCITTEQTSLIVPMSVLRRNKSA